MTAIRWTTHTLQNLVDREIDRSEADQTLTSPEFTVLDPPGRRVLMRRYFDSTLQQEMLMRAVVEEGISETVVITIYKTSQLQRYLRRFRK